MTPIEDKCAAHGIELAKFMGGVQVTLETIEKNIKALFDKQRLLEDKHIDIELTLNDIKNSIKNLQDSVETTRKIDAAKVLKKAEKDKIPWKSIGYFLTAVATALASYFGLKGE